MQPTWQVTQSAADPGFWVVAILKRGGPAVAYRKATYAGKNRGKGAEENTYLIHCGQHVIRRAICFHGRSLRYQVVLHLIETCPKDDES